MMNGVPNTTEFNEITTSSLITDINVLYTFSFFCFYYAHVSTWINYQTEKIYHPVFSVFLCFSVFFILLAGARFRVGINSALHNGTRLSGYKVAPFLLLVMWACSIKSMIAFGTYQFFRWEAPHAIALSIFIIYLVSKIHIYLNYLLFLILIIFKLSLLSAVSPFLSTFLAMKFIISDVTDSLLIKSVIIFLSLLMFTSFKQKIPIKPWLKYFLYAVLSFAVGRWLWSNAPFFSFETNVLKSLPYGIIIGDSRLSQHAFGLIFWLPIVLSGFIFTDVILNIKNNKYFNFMLWSTSLCILLYLLYTFTFLQRSSKYYSVTEFGNEFMMDPFNSNILLFSSLFVLMVYFTSLFYFWFQKIKFFQIVSQSILYQYFFLTLFGPAICNSIKEFMLNFGLKYNFLACLTILLMIGVSLAYIVDYFMSFKIEFTLKPVVKKIDQ